MTITFQNQFSSVVQDVIDNMSLSQFGYSTAYPSPSSPLTASQLLPSSSSTPSSSASPPSMSAAPCCEKGTPLIHPHTGHTICSCQYPTTGMLPYPRLSLPDPPPPPGAYTSLSGYGPAPTQNYVSLPPETAPLYPPLNSPYDLKDSGDSWRGLGPTPGCYPYDPASIPSYPYPNTYGGVDINSAARRKNATRENTNTLKAWLFEHRKNPYPTKGEKIMLAIITKMTLTQVSTWFANARRRLKKENKMTWSPRNKPGDNDDDDNDDDKEKNDNDDSDDDNKGSISASNDGRDSQSSVDMSAQDCSGVRGHPITTQLFDPPHQDQGSSSLGHQYGAFDVNSSSLGASQQHSMISSRSLNYGTPQHLHHHTSNNNNNINNSNNPHLYHHLPSNELQAMSPYGHLQNPKSASLGYAPSPANQNIHNNNTLEGISQMPLKLEQSSSMTRPDSLCSSSNDSGLNEAPNSMGGYPGGPAGNGSGAIMDGMRPKIWSLAHEATSDGGYMNHGVGITTSPNNNSGSLLNNKLTGYNNNNNVMTPNHNVYHNNGGTMGNGGVHDGIQQQQNLHHHQQHTNNYDATPLRTHHHLPGGNDESLMNQQQQHGSTLPMTSVGLDQYPNNNGIDQHHHHHHDPTNPGAPLGFHSPPPPPPNDNNPHHSSSSPLSPSSPSSSGFPSSSSSNTLSSLLPPSSHNQWSSPSMYHHHYYPPYNNSPPLHPAPQYQAGPPPPSLQPSPTNPHPPPPSLPLPPQSHTPLAPPPHLSSHSSSSLRGTLGQSNTSPYPNNTLASTGSDGGCEAGGGIPSSPSSLSSPAITPSSTTSTTSSSSSMPAQGGYSSVQPSPNFFDNSKIAHNCE